MVELEFIPSEQVPALDLDDPGFPYVLGSPPFERRGETMVRLADDARECVVYLGKPQAGSKAKIDPVGTGFIVTHDGAKYLVTARHVVEHEKKIDELAIRLNNRDGRGEVDRIAKGWVFHPTDTALDIAVMRYDPPDWAVYKPFSTGDFATATKIKTKNLGPGDIAYVVGVFAELHGKIRNIPLVHIGHLAQMPGPERIPIKDWNDPKQERAIYVDGYLLQVQTIPGSSGSPVFVRRTLRGLAQDEKCNPLKVWLHGSVWLLGLWHGSWLARPDQEIARIYDELACTPLSLGFGAVIPAIQILEVLNQEKLKTARLAVAAKRATARAVSPQRAAAPLRRSPRSDRPQTSEDEGAEVSLRAASEASAADNPRHKEDFTNLLRAAAKGRKPSRKTSRKARGGS